MTEGLRTQRPATAWSSTSVGRANEKQGSFSTVSRPNLATKYGFESSRRDLHNALKCTPLHSSVISFFSQNFANFCKIVRNLMKFSKLAKFLKISANFGKILAIFFEKNVLLELCKGVHCVDLGESFPTHILLQNLASIQPRTSPVKFRLQNCRLQHGPDAERPPATGTQSVTEAQNPACCFTVILIAKLIQLSRIQNYIWKFGR